MEKLGINPILIGFQVINFFILFWILKRFLYRPVLELLEQRKQRAQEIEDLKLKLTDQDRQLEIKKKEVIEQGRHEAQKIVEAARIQGDKTARQIQADSQKQTQKVLADARLEIERQKSQLRNELKAEIGQLTINVAEKILAGQLQPEQKDQVLSAAVERFDQ